MLTCSSLSNLLIAQIFNGTFIVAVAIKNPIPFGPHNRVELSPHLFLLNSFEMNQIFNFEETIKYLIEGKKKNHSPESRDFELHTIGIIDANEATREGMAQVLKFIQNLSFRGPNQGRVLLGGDQLTTKNIRGELPQSKAKQSKANSTKQNKAVKNLLQNESESRNFQRFQEGMLGLHQQFCYISIIFENWWGSESVVGSLSQLSTLIRRGVSKTSKFQDQLRFLEDVTKAQILALKHVAPEQVDIWRWISDQAKYPMKMKDDLSQFSASLLQASLLFFSFRQSLQYPGIDKEPLLKIWTIACIGAGKWNYAKEGCFFLETLFGGDPEMTYMIENYLTLPGLFHDVPLDQRVETGIGVVKSSRSKAGRFSLARTQRVSSSWETLVDGRGHLEEFLGIQREGFHHEKKANQDITIMAKAIVDRVLSRNSSQKISPPTVFRDGMEKAHEFFHKFCFQRSQNDSAEVDEE